MIPAKIIPFLFVHARSIASKVVLQPGQTRILALKAHLIMSWYQWCLLLLLHLSIMPVCFILPASYASPPPALDYTQTAVCSKADCSRWSSPAGSGSCPPQQAPAATAVADGTISFSLSTQGWRFALLPCNSLRPAAALLSPFAEAARAVGSAMMLCKRALHPRLVDSAGAAGQDLLDLEKVPLLVAQRAC